MRTAGLEPALHRKPILSRQRLPVSPRPRTRTGRDEDAAKVKQTETNSIVGVSGAVTMTAVERAIESLAAMVGKSYIKEEIVHGSYR